MRGPIFPSPITSALSQPVAVPQTELPVNASIAAKKEFITQLMSQLMKEGFFSSEESTLWGDGPNKDYIRTILTEKISQMASRSLPVDGAPPVTGEP